MELHFVSFFGLAPGAEKLTKKIGNAEDLTVRQKHLHETALKNGKVDVTHEWTRDRLLATDYYQENKELLDQARGCGYWAWKPYLILQTLAQTQPGDYVIYCDVGRPTNEHDEDHGNLITTSLMPLVEWAERHNGMLPGVYLSNHGPAKHWVKRDCFLLMECDTTEYHEMPTVQAGYTVWKNTPNVIKFLEQWKQLNTDARLITDQNNTLGLDNHEGFIRHCHDQATLTLLCQKEKATVFGSDKSQFWGFRNINYLALEAAYQNAAANQELQLRKINSEHDVVPNYLVRWIELLMFGRRQEVLNLAIITDEGSQDSASLNAWKSYLPNSNVECVSVREFNDKVDTYHIVLGIALKQDLFNNELLMTLYRSMKYEGVMFLAPLPQQTSQLEVSARAISSKGAFPADRVFDCLSTSPKIPNSRNPIFLSGKNKKTGAVDSLCLMVKPTPVSTIVSTSMEAM